jgi:hypothetical protein
LSRRRTLVVALWVVSACLLPAVEASAAKRIFGQRALAKGSTGRDVRVLQDFLTRWGLRTHVDGVYGRMTARQVRRWERLRYRPADGAMSLEDAAELRRAVEAGERRPPGPIPPPIPPVPSAAMAQTATATLAPDGTAIPPAGAPDAVVRLIAAANAIHDKPYKYGGGHGSWEDSGYDCSGSMSFAYHGAGLLDTALDSTGFMSWGDPGPGAWVTNYANPGHSFMVIAGLRFDTSGRAEDNSRWATDMRSSSGYTVRHPPGL